MRILFHVPRLPYPPNTGSRIRTLQLISKLSKHHHVTVVCLRHPSEDSDEKVEQLRAHCSRLVVVEWRDTAKFTPRFYLELLLNVFSQYPYVARKYESAAARAEIRRLLGAEHFDVLIAEMLQAGLNLIPIPFSPKILSEHNVESVILKRHYLQARNPIARVYLYLQWRKLRRFESRAGRVYDHCIMISDQDRRTMAEEFGITNTSVVPIGVDVDYFRPSDGESDSDAASASDTLAGSVDGNCGPNSAEIVFIGSMDWLPNEDATFHFVRNILPLIRREMAVKFKIVGRNPSRALQRLPEEHADIEVTGTVDDIRPHVARAKVVVVPLQIGGGVRIKIFEAMAMGKAIVSTTVGAEGLPVTDGQNILIADDPRHFARRTLDLLCDQQLRRHLERAAREFVVKDWSWEKTAELFVQACERTIATVRKRPQMTSDYTEV